uniref:Uncharacterized protein n=1 Tax=Tanacetum cinerariifolium TaxID=118510 RepID=A0A6L2P1H3_TANCI|nr:hypothetical protein [Tanacetum cinerariifolium]
MAFVSSSSNNSNNKNGVNTTQGVNIANRVNTTSTQVNVASSLNIDNLSDAVICAFLGTKGTGQQESRCHKKDYTSRDTKLLSIGLFPLPKLNLSYKGLEELFNKPKTKKSKDKSNDVEPESIRKGSDASIIEDWVSDDEEQKVKKKKVKPSIHRINFVKDATDNNPRETVKNVLTVNVAKLINGVHPKRTMNAINQESYFSKQPHSLVQRPNKKLTALKNSYANKKVKTIWVKKVNTAKPIEAVNAAKAKAKHKAVKGKRGNAVKASACWGNLQEDLHDKGVIDSGCSRHMIRNMSFLTNYKEIDGGYVAFGENPKGGKITGKGTKDETSGTFKSFIIRVENLMNLRVKVIRCDNGTKFKNVEMNQFCKVKGVMRQYSVARTLQQNRVAERVLVTKPHNKTPYELFHGRTPAIRFLRPFRCLVTILNTIDHLGKFDGKADEGFFVGYSLNSKAFRVFNSRTRIIEENLHVRFSKNTPNNVGTKASNGIRKEKEPERDYILLPLWTADSPFSSISKNSQDNEFQPLNDGTKKVDDHLRKENECNNQREEDSNNNTNRVNTVTLNINAASSSGVNDVGINISIDLPPNPNMPSLEDIGIFKDSHDDEDVFGIEAGFHNLDSTFQVSLISTTRIYKDHLFEQVIRDLHSAPQKRRMTKNLEEHGLVEEVYVCQPPRFEDPDFPDKVYKIEKALYGLHQAPKAWYKTLSTYLLDDGFKNGQIDKTLFIKRNKAAIVKKFGFLDVKIASTPMETSKPLPKDKDEEEVDVHMYRSMIGSLMYLTSSRPDIMFAVNADIDVVKDSVVNKQFWTTLKIKTVNDDVRLQDLIDGKNVVINEASIRHDLKLNDAKVLVKAKLKKLDIIMDNIKRREVKVMYDLPKKLYLFSRVGKRIDMVSSERNHNYQMPRLRIEKRQWRLKLVKNMLKTNIKNLKSMSKFITKITTNEVVVLKTYEDKLLKPKIIVEVENKCDVYVNKTSVEDSTDVLENTNDFMVLNNHGYESHRFQAGQGMNFHDFNYGLKMIVEFMNATVLSSSSWYIGPRDIGNPSFTLPTIVSLTMFSSTAVLEAEYKLWVEM